MKRQALGLMVCIVLAGTCGGGQETVIGVGSEPSNGPSSTTCADNACAGQEQPAVKCPAPSGPPTNTCEARSGGSCRWVAHCPSATCQPSDCDGQDFPQPKCPSPSGPPSYTCTRTVTGGCAWIAECSSP